MNINELARHHAIISGTFPMTPKGVINYYTWHKNHRGCVELARTQGGKTYIIGRKRWHDPSLPLSTDDIMDIRQNIMMCPDWRRDYVLDFVAAIIRESKNET